jgi:hypothetical protein
MTRARNKSNPDTQKVSARLMEWLDTIHEVPFSDTARTILKNLAINMSIVEFTIHLVLIFLARSLAHL